MSRPFLLMVEDDPYQAVVFSHELQEIGYDVEVVDSGDEALHFVEKQEPDLVILDIHMPSMDGLEALQRMLDVNRQLPVILHTCYPGYQEDLRTWSAARYVIKSIDMTALKDAIAEVLAEHTVPVPASVRAPRAVPREWEDRLHRLLAAEGGCASAIRIAEHFHLCLHEVQSWLEPLVEKGDLAHEVTQDGSICYIPAARAELA